MIRKIIHIDEEKCNGCGACVTACHEGAIGLVNGKAKLMRDDYCDGFGDCLPGCPTGAITFTEREAAAYDEQAVLENKQKKSSGCTGSSCPACSLGISRLPGQPDAPVPPGGGSGSCRGCSGKSALTAGPVALPDQAGACERPPTLQGPSFWWRQTARRMPMPMSIRSSCGAK